MLTTFFRMGGFSMFIVLGCGLAGLLVALYASGRPSEPPIRLADRLAKAELFFSIAGYASNVAATLYAVANTEHTGDGFSKMLVTGLYESTAPIIMGFTFIALIHLALGVAGFRLARREP
jgi:hypothetical protein